jgi:hypothetical protein
VALPKQTVFVPLGVGLQQETDPKQLVIGQGTTLLENAVQVRTGEVVKRYGATALSSLVTTSGSIPQTADLATHQGALVSRSVSGSPQLYAYSPTRTRWAQVDTRLQATVSTTRTPVEADSNSAQIPDSKYAAGYQWVATEELASGVPSVVINVIDATTGHVVNQVTHANGTRPRVGTISGYVAIAYVDSTTADLKCDVFSTATPETYSAVTLASARIRPEGSAHHAAR